MQRFEKMIVRYFEKKNITDPKDREIYIYGLDTALYTFLSTAGLLLLSLPFGRLGETVLLIAFFYTNQTLGGGFHATSHMRCFMTMAAGLLVFYAALAIPYSMPLCLCAGVASLLFLLYFPLILHENKRYLAHKSAAFARRSRAAVGVQGIIFLITICVPLPFLAHPLSIALFLCALSRLVALAQRKLKK